MVGRVTGLLTGEHGRRFTFEVHVGITAHVDRDPVDRAAGELVRVDTRGVVGDRLAAVPADTPGGSSPSLSNEADRIWFSPNGTTSVPSIFCSTRPTKLLT